MFLGKLLQRSRKGKMGGAHSKSPSSDDREAFDLQRQSRRNVDHERDGDKLPSEETEDIVQSRRQPRSRVSTSMRIKGTIEVVAEDEEGRYVLMILPRTTIEHVKVILRAQYGVDMTSKRFIYRGEEIHDTKMLSDYDLSTGDVLQIEKVDDSPEGRLMNAAFKGDLEGLKTALLSGTGVNSKGKNRRGKESTALHAAVDGGHEKVVRYLILSNANIDAVDEEGLTPIQLAASRRNYSVFSLLFNKGADLRVVTNGMKLVHFAAIGGHVNVLELLKPVCNLEEKTDEGITPMHLAASHGRLEAVLWLVEIGSNFNLRDKKGWTPEDFAREKDYNEIASYLSDWSLLQQKKFLQVAIEGKLEMITAFFTIGIDVDCKNQDENGWGQRAIHMASLAGQSEVIIALLLAGARREAEDDMGNKAVHYAAAGGQIGTLKILQKEGCKVNVCNNLNMTPLHFAAVTDQVAVASWLMAQGVEAGITSTKGYTALDIAESEGHMALADILRKSTRKRQGQSTDVVTIEKILGRGAFGEVYLAKMNNREIVVKKIHFNAGDQEEIELAMRELLLMKNLNHPNIVTFMGCRREDKHLNIIMEYCSGGDLAQRIKQHKRNRAPFEEKLLTNWTARTASALSYIHSRKILHRDLKPANLFISSSGAIKLGDFGLARMMGQTDFVRSFVGTPVYMSPEVMKLQPYNDKADMWSFGCILYELATFQYAVENLKNLVIPSKYSGDFRRLVVALLNTDYTKRPTAFEVSQLPFLKKTQPQAKSQHRIRDHLGELHKEQLTSSLMNSILSL